MEALANDPVFPEAGRLTTGTVSATGREADSAKLADVPEPLVSLAAEVIRLMAPAIARLAGLERDREAATGDLVSLCPPRRASRLSP